jgi:hypothetical protein
VNYQLLQLPNGRFLADIEDDLVDTGSVGDAAMWYESEQGFVNAVSRRAWKGDEPGQIEVLDGPEKLPSDYLRELKEQGFTTLDGVLKPDSLERIRRVTKARVRELDPSPPDFDDRFGVPHGISWSADICRGVTNAVALWLIRSYLGTDEIHFCHQPAMTVLRPSKESIGAFPESGWHSDYPYHPDVYPEDRWQDEQVYGVQYNICIDEFRADNAATQFVPGSHRMRQFPPVEMNRGGTRMGTPPHEGVVQMLAPAGAALIYDARTWHRACTELNSSGRDRLAILNAVCPRWVRPMADKTRGTKQFVASGTAQQLNEREQNELNRLCHEKGAPPPDGAPSIGAKERQPLRLSL